MTARSNRGVRDCGYISERRVEQYVILSPERQLFQLWGAFFESRENFVGISLKPFGLIAMNIHVVTKLVDELTAQLESQKLVERW